jgi:outer membrane protein assembly factor BamB
MRFARLVVSMSACAVAMAVGVARAETPREIYDATGVRGGLVVHLGCGDGKLTTALRVGESYLVHGLDHDMAKIETARKHIQEMKRYGPVSVDRLTGERLPYIDNCVNLVVAEESASTPTEEIQRVLAPLGVAYVKKDGAWTKKVKPWPKEIDEWTHFRHDAGGTTLARDARVGPARHVQWWGEPMFCRSHELPSSVSTMVSARGRLFYVFDEGLVTLGETWHKSLVPQYRLVARDAFNGILLWKKPIADWGFGGRGGRMGWAPSTWHRLVADGDRVFVTLGMTAPVSVLDAATGEVIRTYAGTDGTEEILFVAGTLVLRAQDRIIAVDANTGQQRWSRQSKRSGLRTIVANADVVAFCDGEQVSSVDLKTGGMKWTHPLAKGFRLTLGDSWLFCQTGDGLSALALDSGRQLWKKDGAIRHGNVESAPMGHPIFFGNKTLWIEPSVGLDPATGEVKTTVKGGGGRGHHPRCYPPKATENYMLTTKRGLEYLDLKQGGETPCDWTRGPCGVGVMPCNGLTYVPPNQCACYQGVKLNGFWAYAASTTPGETPPPEARLERGPAYGKVGAAETEPDAWPAYRRDARLSASTPARAPTDLKLQWHSPIGGKLASPVAAYGLVAITAVDQHTVYALEVKTGAEVWRFTAGGRINSPPTFHKSLMLFGSADGWVYCLRASDGALAWRYQAAPEERRVGSWGQVESAWPVHGAVTIVEGIGYAVAGRSTYLDGGIRVCALDPATGRKLHEATLQGPNPTGSRDATKSTGFTMEGAFSDLLVSDGKHLYMSQIMLDKSLKQIEPPLMNRAGDKRTGLRLCTTQGFLTDPWFSRGFWMYARRWPGYRRRFEEAPKTGTLLCFNEKTVCVLKAFDIGGHSPYFYPARQGYLLFVDDVDTEPQLWGEEGSSEPVSWLTPGVKGAARVPTKGDPDRVGPSGGDVPYTRAKPPHWTARVPIRVHGMVLAADILFIAGPPDVVDPKDPLASFKGRMGGKLWAVSSADGRKIAECELASPPVFDGMAVAYGHLFVATMDGTVLCFGDAK